MKIKDNALYDDTGLWLGTLKKNTNPEDLEISEFGIFETSYEFLRKDHDFRQKAYEFLIEQIQDSLKWGTFGIKGDQPMQIKRLVDCDTAHLHEILATQHQISELYKRVILAILKNRWVQAANDTTDSNSDPDY